jgi:hypothetical protein
MLHGKFLYHLLHFSQTKKICLGPPKDFCVPLIFWVHLTMRIILTFWVLFDTPLSGKDLHLKHKRWAHKNATLYRRQRKFVDHGCKQTTQKQSFIAFYDLWLSFCHCCCSHQCCSGSKNPNKFLIQEPEPEQIFIRFLELPKLWGKNWAIAKKTLILIKM